MPYFVPPGGEVTAAYGRSLMGAGMGTIPTNIRIHRRPLVPPAVVAQELLSARHSSAFTMTGLGIVPSVNVRMPRANIAAGLASRQRRMLRLQREAEMQGLGKVHTGTIVRAGAGSTRGPGSGNFPGFTAPRAAPRTVDVIAKGVPRIGRQAAFFMGPGGGPGGGPFQFPQFPGYSMSGMGLSDDLAPPDVGIPSVPGPPPILQDTSQPAPPPAWFNITPPVAPSSTVGPMAPPNVGTGLPAGVSASLPSWLTSQPITVRAPAFGAPSSFFAKSTLGIPNTLWTVVLGGTVVLASLRGKGRR